MCAQRKGGSDNQVKREGKKAYKWWTFESEGDPKVCQFDTENCSIILFLK